MSRRPHRIGYRELLETIPFYAALWNPQNSGIILAGALSALVVLPVLAVVLSAKVLASFKKPGLA